MTGGGQSAGASRLADRPDFLAKRYTSVEEINEILTAESQKPEWRGIIKVSSEQLVSTDIIGEPFGSIVDLGFTKVIDGDLVKIFSWYDNEWGYAAMLIKHIETLKNICNFVMLIPAINADTFEEVQRKSGSLSPMFLGRIWISPTEHLPETPFGIIYWNSL